METILSIGLWNAAGATVLALAAAGAALFCRRPAVLHALWLLVLLKLLTPPLWQVPVAWPEPEPAPEAREPVQPLAEPVPEVVELPVNLRVGELAPETPAMETAPESAAPLPGPTVVLALWAAGSLFWFTLTLTRVWRFRRVLGRLAPAPPNLQARVVAVAARLGLRRLPTAYLVTAAVSPLVWALGRARVVIPVGLWQGLGEDQRDLLLAHELAHLRRGDVWVRLVEILALGLYWWHPVAWWARRRLEETGEECCDAWVVSAFPALATDYAHALVESAAYLSAARAAVPTGASGMGRVPSLRRRLTMIVQGRTPRALSRGSALLVIAVAAGLLPLWPVKAELAAALPGGEVLAELHQQAGPPPLQGDAQPGTQPAGPPPARPRPLDQLKAEVEVAQANVAVARAEVKLRATRYAAAKADLEAALKAGKGDEEVGNLKIAVVKWHGEVVQSEQAVKLAEAERDQAQLRLKVALETAPPADKSVPPGKGVLTPFDPAKMFDSTVWNFGNVARGMHVEHHFVFKNTSNKTVKIAAVRSSSTAVKADVGPTEVRPGESTMIDVTLNTGSFTGPKLIYLTVAFSQPTEVEVDLTIQGVSWQPGGSPPKQGDADRLRELEEKLDKLQQELDTMRKELDRGKGKLPRPKAAGGGPITVTESGKFKIPFNLSPSLIAQVGQVVLLVSDDEGATWSLAAKARPDAGCFEFTAPRDGIYWFAVETEDRNGVRQPASKGDWGPQLKVAVRTAPR